MTLLELLKNMRSTYTPIELYNEDCTFIEEGYNHEIKKKYDNNEAFLKKEIYDISLNGESEQIMITLKND